MAETRDTKRQLKRISVSFGIKTAEKFGFTDDLNHDGMFIRSAVTIKPGGTIKVEIKHATGLIALLAEVRWTKKVPQTVLHKMKGGMGVKIKSFLCGEEIYRALCEELIEQRGG